MALSDIGTRLERQNSVLYLGIGILSLGKAGLLGRIGRPVDRELRDAALFIGAGLFLRTYQRRRKARTETAGDGSTAETDRTERTRSAGDAGVDDPGDVRAPTADKPVAVTGTDEYEETGTERDRRRSPLPDVVTDAVNRFSGP